MSIMHIFTIAEGNKNTPANQFRHHYSIPWDEANEYYLKLENLRALVKIARAASNSADDGLKGRIFDVLRAVSNARPSGQMVGRDGGPYVVVTDSSVWTRIELEQYILRMTAEEWDKAEAAADHIMDLLSRL